MPCNCYDCREERGDNAPPPGTITFGWESEFERNATPLAAELHRLGHCGSDYIHSWHCDCPTCDDDSFSFKVQHDSTVNGEVISKVFTSMPEAIEAANALQAAAVEVDAEPGWNAGLHVHVARPRRDDRPAHFLAFVLWENAIATLARGRFTRMRDMNTFVSDSTADRIHYTHRPDNAQRWLVELAHATVDDRGLDNARDLYVRHYEADRHSTLNLNTRFNTWEFRIWNSTRSAWRIEMALRLAVAWRDRDLIDGLLLGADEHDNNVQRFTDIIGDWGGDSDLHALIERQVEYLPLAARTPAAFLVPA